MSQHGVMAAESLEETGSSILKHISEELGDEGMLAMEKWLT